MPKPKLTSVTNFYKNESSDADLIRFSSAESGMELLVRYDSTSLSVPVPNTYTYTFPSTFQYQVGKHQLSVELISTAGVTFPLFNYETWINADSGAVPAPTTYFKELTSSSVQFTTAAFGVAPATYQFVRFFVPHTATPGIFSSKVVVAEQTDDIGIDLQGNGAGIRTKTISGTSVIIRVTDDKTIVIGPG